MTSLVLNFPISLLLALTFAVWVARTLFKKGRMFLVDRFLDQVALADSVNHLLILGGMHFINLPILSRMRRRAFVQDPGSQS